MDLYQFKIFGVIAKHGSLTKAALELGMSQPALTHQMKLLQASYGARLYLRQPSGVALTPAGERLLAGIGPILEMVGRLRTVPEAVGEENRAVLRVGGVESASALLLPSVLARFRAQHPKVELEFRTRTSDQLERMVLSGSVDLAVLARPTMSEFLHCQHLRRERVVLFVSPRHRWANRKHLQASDLAGEPLIVRRGRGGGRVTDRALQKLRELMGKIRVAMYCDGPAEIKAAVARGMGVGLIFEEALRSDIADGRFRVLKIRGLELEGESFLVHSKSCPLNPWAQEFIEMLRAESSRPLVNGTRHREQGSGSRTDEAPRPDAVV